MATLILQNTYSALEDEMKAIDKLKSETSIKISEAASHGDLKENAEYHAAKEQQSHNEGRIQEVEDIIARANVIDVTKINNDGKIIFGSTVYLQNLDRKNYVLIDEKSYQFNTYHTFVIQTKRREKLIKFLKNKGIGTAIHYPIPIHLQPAAKYLGYKKGSFPETEKQSKTILTLPIHQNLKQSDLKKIVYHLNHDLCN